jgi:hypothetical protein
MGTPTVTIKCVICEHRQTIPLTSEMPFCSKCCGPVIVVQILNHPPPAVVQSTDE